MDLLKMAKKKDTKKKKKVDIRNLLKESMQTVLLMFAKGWEVLKENKMNSAPFPLQVLILTLITAAYLRVQAKVKAMMIKKQNLMRQLSVQRSPLLFLIPYLLPALLDQQQPPHQSFLLLLLPGGEQLLPLSHSPLLPRLCLPLPLLLLIFLCLKNPLNPLLNSIKLSNNRC